MLVMSTCSTYNVIKYRAFNNNAFVISWWKGLTRQKKLLDEKELDGFSEICTKVLDKHARQKKRYLRSNYKLFTNNEISKAFMTRTRLRNSFLKCTSNQNRALLCKQINFWVKLHKKQVTDNKSFWKIVKPFLSNKVS